MNVRWDAVVDRERARIPAAEPGPRSPVEAGQSGTAVLQIWLFGSLAPAGVERPLTLTVALPARLGDVMARLAERFGPDFLARVLDAQGGTHSHCRLFIDGQPVEDIATPLAAESQPTQIEMILMTAAEGG